jgi:hypothetical protein
LTDVITDLAALHTIIDDDGKVGGRHNPKPLRMAVEEGFGDDVAMLSRREQLLDLGEDDLSIEVLGSVPEEDDEEPLLRVLGDDDITKNVSERAKAMDTDLHRAVPEHVEANGELGIKQRNEESSRQAQRMIGDLRAQADEIKTRPLA